MLLLLLGLYRGGTAVGGVTAVVVVVTVITTAAAAIATTTALAAWVARYSSALSLRRFTFLLRCYSRWSWPLGPGRLYSSRTSSDGYCCSHFLLAGLLLPLLHICHLCFRILEDIP